jgi:hypothetical protein
LYGKHFVIYCDHKPLTWLIKKENPAALLARWLIRLAKYSFVIKYKKGKKNSDADGLSRMPDPDAYGDDEEYDEYLICLIDVSYPTFVSKDVVTQLIVTNEDQTNDEDISLLVNLIMQFKNDKPHEIPDAVQSVVARALWREYERLEVIDDILYHVNEDHFGNHKFKYVIPSNIINQILHSAHNTAISGHLGFKKTFQRVSERFYRPGLKQIVEEFVKECETCQKVKGVRKNKAELMLLRPVRPNQAIACDIAGPFKQTSRGNMYILVVTDLFTKYTEAYPIQDMTAETVAKSSTSGFVVMVFQLQA